MSKKQKIEKKLRINYAVVNAYYDTMVGIYRDLERANARARKSYRKYYKAYKRAK